MMRIPIQSAVDLGLAVRAVRRNSRVRIDDLAAIAGVSKQFTQDTVVMPPPAQRLILPRAEGCSGSADVVQAKARSR
jgi:hypothetical protein